jgi:NADP-dependent 3-hydroxy acid dehydrogenase YdfG
MPAMSDLLKYCLFFHFKPITLSTILLSHFYSLNLIKSMKTFNNAVIIITGAASGIGKELSKQLAAAGAKLILCDIQEDKLHELVTQLKQAGGTAEAYRLDVTDAAAFEQAIQYIADKYGVIDYLFNNAGIANTGEMQDLQIKHWKKVIDVNLMGVIYGASFGYKQMVKQKKGHIVNIASLAGLCAMPLGLPYTTSKHGVVGLSRGLREEGKACNIKVTVVCPGFIESSIYESAELINVVTSDSRSLIPFKMVPVDKAVSIILKGVVNNKAMIVFPFYGKLFRFLQNNFSSLLNSVHKKTLRDFRKIKQQNIDEQ